MDFNSVEHRAAAASNSFLLSSGKTDLVLHRLSEFFGDEGLCKPQTVNSGKVLVKIRRES